MIETNEHLDHLLKTATDSIIEASAIAEQDERRPRYHFRAPSQWMDDPNGIIYHNGYYHMMYSWNPNSDSQRAGMAYKTTHRVWDPNHEDWTGGITVWGHARSKDLIHWEHLPIALYPIIEKGEHFIWFGTTAINDNGVPIAIYTSVGPQKRPEDTADQWIWFGDEDMINWEPAKENPVLNYDLHGEEILTEWRDPFIVKNMGKTYLILGARRLKKDGADAVVALYEAENADFTAWSYKGVIFSLGDRKVPSCECPNLINMGNKWVLLVSLHGKAEYFIGEMDFNQAHFKALASGMVDHSNNFYATNIMEDGMKRQIMYGAVEGFEGTKGWNGCVSLPREITLKGNCFMQKPAKELEQLRTSKKTFSGRLLPGNSQIVGNIEDGTTEISISIKSEGLTKIKLFGKKDIDILFKKGSFSMAKKEVALEGKEEKNARIYIDRTIIEVFLGNGECVTTVLPEPLMDGAIEVSVEEAEAYVTTEVYSLACENLFSMGLFK